MRLAEIAGNSNETNDYERCAEQIGNTRKLENSRTWSNDNKFLNLI